MTFLTLENPVAFHLLGIPVHWYGIIIAIGMLVALEGSAWEMRRKGFDDDLIYDAALWAIPLGFIGARIYYVAFEWEYYAAHPAEIIQIWKGGIAIYGGVIAGAITLFIFCKRKGIRPLFMTDVVVPFLLLAQSIGRWGNFVNQEAHGGPVSEMFLRETLHLPDFIVNRMQIDGVYYHPTFLYESLWSLVGVVLLLVVRHYVKNLKVGETSMLYLIWYGIGRFFIEGLRTDSLYIGPLRVSQVLSLVFVVGAVIVAIWRRYRYPEIPYYQAVEGNEVRHG